MSDSMKKAYKWLENITESKYLDCDKFGTFSIDKEKLVNDFKSYMGDKIMKYTEKTSGEQIKALLTEMYGEKTSWCDLKYDNGNVGVYRLPETPSIKQLYDLLEKHEIDPLFVTINDMWGHLTMWFCNWDGIDIEIGDQ